MRIFFFYYTENINVNILHVRITLRLDPIRSRSKKSSAHLSECGLRNAVVCTFFFFFFLSLWARSRTRREPTGRGMRHTRYIVILCVYCRILRRRRARVQRVTLQPGEQQETQRADQRQWDSVRIHQRGKTAICKKKTSIKRPIN